MVEPRNSTQLLAIKRQVTSAEINRRRRRKQSEKTPSPGGGWEVGRTQFRWFHRRPISAVPPGRELISQHA
jgi:hypothetical protein